MLAKGAEEQAVEDAFDQAREELYAELKEGRQPKAYHYGSTAAIQVIVETGKLRATDVAFMNDPTEWKHGHDLVADAVKRAVAGVAEFQDVGPRLEKIADHVVSRSVRNFWLFCASLCEDSDDLALWRPYGADGAGCCVGIDFAKVADAHIEGGAAGGRIIYEEQEKSRRVERAVAKHISTCLELRKREVPWKLLFPQFSWSLQVMAGQLAMVMKHRAYRAEHEWRLVQLFKPDDPVKGGWVRYRNTAAGLLAPYVELDVRAALVDVVLGPRQPPEAINAWRGWLQTQKLDLAVRRSEAPYR